MTDGPIPRPASRSLAYVIATSAGAGLAPTWPGTVGAGVGVLFALACQWATPAGAAIACAALFAAGVWSSGKIADSLGTDDPQIVVIDETFGAAATLCLLPPEPLWWAFGFVAFRFFDIAKPGPIGMLQDRVKGGLGIMIDDAAAAVAAAASVLLLREVAIRLF